MFFFFVWCGFCLCLPQILIFPLPLGGRWQHVKRVSAAGLMYASLKLKCFGILDLTPRLGQVAKLCVSLSEDTRANAGERQAVDQDQPIKDQKKELWIMEELCYCSLPLLTEQILPVKLNTSVSISTAFIFCLVKLWIHFKGILCDSCSFL